MADRSTIQAGELDQRILLEAPAKEQSGHYGQAKPAYAPVCERWAKVESLSGRDTWYGQQHTNLATHKITMRATGLPGGLDASWRAQWLGAAKTLNFETVTRPAARGDALVIFAIEKVKGG